ncbi:hypothetical protein [Desulfocastanea catecholica]
MNICRLVKVFSVVLCLGMLFLSGCANFLHPEMGAIARPEARISLAENGVQEALWQTKDLLMSYSIAQSDTAFSLSGQLVFDRSLTDSFPMIKRFTLKMNFLDGEGGVIETVDITPLFSSFGQTPDELTIRFSGVRPAAAAAIAFNYYGAFRGSAEEMGGASWDIFYFPFD